MSASIDNQEYDPVANLHMQPAKGILKSNRSVDDAGQDVFHHTASATDTSTTGMTRSESKSHKIPHFDEMNIIATYHPANKDYGHMKIEEPKTPYAPNEIIDEEVGTEAIGAGIDPGTLAQRLNESKVPSSHPSRLRSDRLERKSIDEGSEASAEDLEHRKHFESHRKQHYNEFEIVRLRKKEIEDELRALEQEENSTLNSNGSAGGGKSMANLSTPRSSVDSIKPILVHHPKDSSSTSGHHHHHVHVEDGHDDEPNLSTEEREKKKQFELKRKKHYNEFRAARKADEEDDEEGTTG